MMPALFPRLLPGMMPKVMPDMLDAVGERIAMPEAMQDQMPDLTPPAMENLMPKMLPEVIPYFMPGIEADLRGKPVNGHQPDKRPALGATGRALLFSIQSLFVRDPGRRGIYSPASIRSFGVGFSPALPPPAEHPRLLGLPGPVDGSLAGEAVVQLQTSQLSVE